AANNTASTIEQFDSTGNAKLFAQYNSDPAFIAVQLLSPTAVSIQFSSPRYSANETGGSVFLTVTRNGDVSGSATVHYATADGTATSPDDYSAASGDLSFDPDETSKTIQIPLNEQADPANEDSEPNPWTFSVTLNNANGAMLSGPATATVTII